MVSTLKLQGLKVFVHIGNFKVEVIPHTSVVLLVKVQILL
jgi:hypothetical protein